MTRDVSCFYPADLSTEKILALIKDVAGGVRNVTDGTSTELVKNLYLVDSFEKKLDDGTMKKSVAFRIVYQAEDRTLTDNEINVEVDRVYEALRDAGCELR